MTRREGKASPQIWRKSCVQDEWWSNKPCKRADIERLRIHDTEIMIGGKHRRQYGPYVEEILEDNFTPKEIARVNNLYIETNPKFLGEGVGGVNESFDVKGQEKASIIKIPHMVQGKNVKSGEGTLTHEAIHALRNAMDRQVEDIDGEESATELETICRISKEGMNKMTAGYYNYLPGMKTHQDCFDAQDQDRLLLNVEYEYKRKGDDAIRRVHQKYPESNISKLDLSGTNADSGGDAENIDRYFLIETKDKTVRLHERDSDGIVPPLRQTRKRLKRRYGKDAKIFEWHNGKKVNISNGVGNKKRYSNYMQRDMLGCLPQRTVKKTKTKKNAAKKPKKTVVKRKPTKKERHVRKHVHI